MKVNEIAEARVTGVSIKPAEYYVELDNGGRIRVDNAEYKRVKRKLAGKGEYYLKALDEEVAENE